MSVGACSSVVERVADNDEVLGPIPSTRTNFALQKESFEVHGTLTEKLSYTRPLSEVALRSPNGRSRA